MLRDYRKMDVFGTPVWLHAQRPRARANSAAPPVLSCEVPGLQEQHLFRPVLTEPMRHHAPRGAAADHDVVVASPRGGRPFH